MSQEVKGKTETLFSGQGSRSSSWGLGKTERVLTLGSLDKALHLEEKEPVFRSPPGNRKSVSDGTEAGWRSVHSMCLMACGSVERTWILESGRSRFELLLCYWLV